MKKGVVLLSVFLLVCFYSIGSISAFVFDQFYCGDGIVSSSPDVSNSEQCDPGINDQGNNEFSFFQAIHCNSPDTADECQCAPDSVWDGFEKCLFCGDGILTKESPLSEECDSTNHCSLACKCSPVYVNDSNGNCHDCWQENLNGKNCSNFNFNSGTLKCNPDGNFDTSSCFNCPPGQIFNGNSCLVNESDFELGKVLIYVPQDYKTNRLLNSGDSIEDYAGDTNSDNIGDYEEEGLAELIGTGGKCLDCIGDKDKSKIKGIITEYDDLTIETTINVSQALDLAAKPLFIKFQIIGSKGLISGTISLGNPDYCTKQNLLYTCKFKFNTKGYLFRGSLISANVSVENIDATIIKSKSTDYFFAVAKYVFHVFHVNSNSFGYFYDSYEYADSNQYSYFNTISDFNKKISYVGKYVEHNNALSFDTSNPISWSLSAIVLNPYPTLNQALKGSGVLYLNNVFGFNPSLDRDILYFPKSDILHICYQISSTSFIGGGCVPKGSLSGPVWAIFLNKDSSSPNILSHELGHSYSELSDEYAVSAWKKYNSIVNPVGFSGSVNYPKCCLENKDTYHCCKIIDNGGIHYYWGKAPPELFNGQAFVLDGYCNLGGNLQYTVNAQGEKLFEDSACISNIGQKAFYNLKSCWVQDPLATAINYDSIIYNPGSCWGMQYLTPDNSQPFDLFGNSARKAISVMGSTINDSLQYVYPKNAACPLQGCI